MPFVIKVKDEDTEEWRDADESDGLDCPNNFLDRSIAECEKKRIVGRCAYRFPAKVVKE